MSLAYSIGVGQSIRRTTDAHAMSENTRPFQSAEPQDLDNSKLDFLEKQTSAQEEAYKTWARISSIANTLTILITIALVGVWFYWLSKLDSPDIACTNLKCLIIWTIVIYFVGMFGQVLGLISGRIKSMAGFLIYQIVLVVLLVLRVVFDVPTINSSVTSLEGCAVTKSTIQLSDYIFGTMFYCLVTMLLFSLNLKMIYAIRKLKQTQRIQYENMTMTRKDRYISSHV